MIINSLKRINESDAAHDIRYKTDLAKADADYQKADPSYKPLLFNNKFARRLRNPYAAEDRDRTIKISEDRYNAAKKGFVSKHDYNEAKIEGFKAKKLAAKAAGKIKQDSTGSEHTPGIIRKIGGAIAEHPYIAAGTVAGIAGLAALQKRKKRLPEPGSY